MMHKKMFTNGRTESLDVNDLSLASSITDLGAIMKQDQQATLAALRDLNASLEKLIESQSQEYVQGEENVNIDRTTVRLDGVEVYAVVSALTIATSIACFDAFNCGDWEQLFKEKNYAQLMADWIFLAATSVGIVSAIHATLVFSLMTMYGRTAVGLDRDDAFHVFFKSTAAERYRGFRTFLISMYAFLIQIAILISSECPEKGRFLALAGTLTIIYGVYRDTTNIIARASPIFTPRLEPPRPSMRGKRFRSFRGKIG